jgi:hypothetical protein
MNTARRWLVTFLAACMAWAGMLQTAHARLIGTEAVAAAQAGSAADPADARARLAQALERPEVVAALAERGVDVEQARERVAALTDDEAAMLAQHVDDSPAGGSVLGVVLFVFVLLLITDILGFTKVFPFTRSVR